MNKKNLILIAVIVAILLVAFVAQKFVYKYVDLGGSQEPMMHEEDHHEDPSEALEDHDH